MNFLLEFSEREDKLPTEYRLPKPPDCSKPNAIEEWQWEDLSVEDREYLSALYLAQPDAVDRLGSTSTMSRMAIVFSARTGRPTSPHTLFRELMALRKDGQLPKRR